MARTARVSSDIARYYRSNQGKAALTTLALAIVGVMSGKRGPIAAAMAAFFGVILPINVTAFWRQQEQQEATNKELAELSAAVPTRHSDLDLGRIREFETDVVMARAQDLTRFDAIENRLNRLEANQ